MELKGLKTKFLGRNVLYFQSIDSTQKKVKSLKQPENGTIVIAENQVAGYGTHDRKWYTGSGKNIAMSFVLTPNCSIKKIENITLMIADVMVNVLRKMHQIELVIKVPNDLYYEGKKVGGILTQTICKGEIIRKIFVGIGLNVNQEKFPGNLSNIATSLKNEFHEEFDREEIMVEFLNEFEREYKKLGIKNEKNSN